MKNLAIPAVWLATISSILTAGCDRHVPPEPPSDYVDIAGIYTGEIQGDQIGGDLTLEAAIALNIRQEDSTFTFVLEIDRVDVSGFVVPLAYEVRGDADGSLGQGENPSLEADLDYEVFRIPNGGWCPDNAALTGAYIGADESITLTGDITTWDYDSNPAIGCFGPRTFASTFTISK